MEFMNELKNEMTKATQLTENGALGFSTSGAALVDMNFKISSYRNLSDTEIFNDFMKAYVENRMLAMRWLFYARDVRGGIGERRLFRVILKNLEKGEPETVKKVLHLVAAFGRWDDLFTLMGTSLETPMLKIVAKQLSDDIVKCSNNQSISLLAKWMPSINGSSKSNIAIANKLAKTFDISPKVYRQTLSRLRAHLKVVETQMSAKQWDKIEYKGVTSRANLIYNPAFLKHDEERRRSFLEKVEKGEEKIHSATNFPHDIVHKYSEYAQKDTNLEELWKALPDYGVLENTIVVADGSGSMTSTIGKTKVSALEVANSLAIYFAEHCNGGFKNNYITFSETPQLVNLGDSSLFSKIHIAEKHSEVANTNIQAVFELILNTAVSKGMKQSELPGTILVISDMEFDSATYGNGYAYGWGSGRKVAPFSTPNATLFAQLAKKFAANGYKLPKLAFWNIMSRTMTIPVQTNEAGVILVSGFSPAAIKMVLCGKADPFEALVEILMDKKYDVVEEAIR